MKPADAKHEIEQLARTDAGASDHDQIEKLFRIFIGMQQKLRPDDEEADTVLTVQSVLLRTAATLSARTHREVLFKLALWRWDAIDANADIDAMTRDQAVAFSAFEDLAALLNEPSVRTLSDKSA
ncbi:MAG: hypothetical protein AAGC56_11515 [Pseudomonadota bacterium]